MVEELVRVFVPEAMAADLDFSRLERVNPKFHGSRRRESDAIWRLPTSKGVDVYLMLEFQSKNDWWMSVRTQVYQGLLWQQVIAEKKLKMGAPLPPLLLLVLYNGVSRWDASTETRKLTALSPRSSLWPWQPQVRYHLFDVGAFTEAGLVRRTNLAALLFRIERRPSVEQLHEISGELVDWYDKNPDEVELVQLFAELIRHASPESTAPSTSHQNPLEEILMFKSNIVGLDKVWKSQYRAEGLAEGLAQGKADSLIRLLRVRFGAVGRSRMERIRKAKRVTLERWFDRAIVAPTLGTVFGSKDLCTTKATSAAPEA